MKKIDFILQALIIAGVAVSFIPFGVYALVWALYAQLFLGLYQPASALIRYFYRKDLLPKTRSLLNYYWIITLGYLLLTGVFIYLASLGNLDRFIDNDNNFIAATWLMIIPWGIALFYTYISFFDAYASEEKRSKFLPNIHI